MEIRLPAKPEIEKKQDKGEDLRKFAVVPFAAIGDKRVKHHAFRVLAAICAHSNRAGVSYAGQRTLARFLNTQQSQVSHSMTALKDAGYIKVIGKSVQGLRGETVQVVFDPNLSLDDVIGIASAKTDEDLRPPEQKEQELAEMIADNEKDWTAAELKANKERLAKMLIEAFNTPKDSTKAYTPNKNDSMAVKKIKEEIRSRMRQIRKEQLSEQHDHKNRSKHKYLCSDNQSASSNDVKPDHDVVCRSEQRDALTYEGIVEIVSNQLMNGVKTESDIQGCAWLAEIGCTADMLNRYIAQHPGDTAYDIAKRIINGA